MIICNVDNENVYKFIQRKKTAGLLSGANISVGITDTFMEFVLSAKAKIKQGYGLTMSTMEESSLELWHTLIESAWTSAEPGIVWLERYNKESNSWYFHEIVATNPCGEQGLPPFGVCNLGHFVLSRFFDKDTGDVNWDDLARAIEIAVRLQDNIIDYTPYFLDENKDVQLNERRVGIGTLGLGTLLILKGLRYGSEEGNKFVDYLYKFIAVNAYSASIDLAKEKGAFPKFEYDKFIQSGFMKRLLGEFPELKDDLKKYGIRNVTLLTQAPTGSTGTYIDNIPEMRSICGGTTTGIEPYYSWSYWRAGRLGVVEQTVDIALDYMKEHGLSSTDELPEHFACAMDLEPIDHVKVQATVQKWTDSSISKTANCPEDFTIEQTDELYTQSYLMGLKGMTIYRAGSRESQVLAVNKEDAKIEHHTEADKLKELKGEAEKGWVETAKEVLDKTADIWVEITESEREEIINEATGSPTEFKKVPSRLFGMREKVRYQSGDKMSKAYVHIYTDENGVPMEIWIAPTDDSDKDMADALGRMTTQLLRFGATNDNVEQAVKHLKKGKMMMSLPAIVGRLIEQVYYGKIEMPSFGNKEEVVTAKKKFELQECTVCGAKAYDKGNCICIACGQSKCN